MVLTGILKNPVLWAKYYVYNFLSKVFNNVWLLNFFVLFLSSLSIPELGCFFYE